MLLSVWGSGATGQIPVNGGPAGASAAPGLDPRLGAMSKRAGDEFVSVGRLLQVLDLEERLIDIGLRIDDARSALARGDLTTVGNHLERMEAQLSLLVDLPWRS